MTTEGENMTSARAVDPDDVSGEETASVPPAWISAPTEAERAPVWEDRIPRRAGEPVPAMWLLGAHGGAGVSTLEAVWAPAGDSRRGWPAAERAPFVVIVARMHQTGLDAAHRLVMQHKAGAAGDCSLLGLVTVAAAPGKPDVSLTRRRELVASAAGADWHIGWVSELLSTEPGSLATWTPGYTAPEARRFSRPPAATEAVPTDFVRAAEGVFDAARAAWQSS